MTQMLLFPDPRPLVERLGPGFFRSAPNGPGVYLMRSAAETVLYVGKAKNLRKRLASYRVANPDRMPRRHLRMLRAVERIEFEKCADERAALAREAELLRTLRPQFNRAGTWPAPRRFLIWRLSGEGLELGVTEDAEASWNRHGPLGAGAFHLRAALLRLLWSGLHAELGVAGMPGGWFAGRHPTTAAIPRLGVPETELEAAAGRLSDVFAGRAEPLVEWVRERTPPDAPLFQLAARDADLETIIDFAGRLPKGPAVGA